MREIKFRAWDEKKNRMFPVREIDWCTFQNMINTWEYLVSYRMDGYYQLNPIMQYTGLKDKNSKEIYEGDILKNQYGDYKIVKYKTEVIENCGCCDNISVIGYDFSNFWYDGKEIEIIGNKYENLELLEKQK